MQGDTVKKRGNRDIFSTARADRIETHGAHDIPGTHLSAVLVSAETVWVRSVELGEDAVHDIVQFVGGTKVGIEIGCMVRRLVAVGILPYHASNIDLVATGSLTAGVEKRIEESLGLLLAAHLSNPSRDVVRYVSAVLPAIGFGEVVVDFGRVKGGDETAVAACMHKAVGIHDVLPRLRTAHIGVVHLIQVAVG